MRLPTINWQSLSPECGAVASSNISGLGADIHEGEYVNDYAKTTSRRTLKNW